MECNIWLINVQRQLKWITVPCHVYGIHSAAFYWPLKATIYVVQYRYQSRFYFYIKQMMEWMDARVAKSPSNGFFLESCDTTRTWQIGPAVVSRMQMKFHQTQKIQKPLSTWRPLCGSLEKFGEKMAQIEIPQYRISGSNRSRSIWFHVIIVHVHCK